MIIDVGGSIKPVKLKEFAVFWNRRRIEEGFNGAVNEITEAFPAMGLGVEVIKLNVRSESFQLQMGFSFPFLRANDLRSSLLNIRARSFLLSCT